jgi:hypothetical protein
MHRFNDCGIMYSLHPAHALIALSLNVPHYESHSSSAEAAGQEAAAAIIAPAEASTVYEWSSYG